MESRTKQTFLQTQRLVIVGCVVAVVWFAIDQVTKGWIVESLISSPRAIPISSYFNLVLGWNRGVSFGFLADFALPPWMLTMFALSVVIALLIWLARASKRFVAISLGFVTGGALGNALDRVRHGAVVDFLDFHLAGWHWPAFNFADVGIVCGLLALVLDSFLFGKVEATPASYTPDP